MQAKSARMAYALLLSKHQVADYVKPQALGRDPARARNRCGTHTAHHLAVPALYNRLQFQSFERVIGVEEYHGRY